jgi:hypothetical protein
MAVLGGDVRISLRFPFPLLREGEAGYFKLPTRILEQIIELPLEAHYLLLFALCDSDVKKSPVFTVSELAEMANVDAKLVPEILKYLRQKKLLRYRRAR